MLLLGNLLLTPQRNLVMIFIQEVLPRPFFREMDEEKLGYYDRLINLPTNDWEIYAWAVGQKETPDYFDNIVMDMLK